MRWLSEQDIEERKIIFKEGFICGAGAVLILNILFLFFYFLIG